jgi:UDP-glucose-4-epimerase GalE
VGSERVEFIEGDVRDRARVLDALNGCDAVMHFAAFSIVSESVREPRKYFDNNVTGGRTLLECVLEAATPYFIFSSSAAVYGLPADVPIPDHAPRRPINPYGKTKLVVEEELEALAATRGLRYLSLRYFNAAGADEAGGIGELHSPETHLIPRALETAAGARPHIDVYGTDYPTPDGTCIRDYIHVSDLAEAHVLGLDYLAGGGAARAFNLGTGRGHSVKEVLDAVERITGRRLARNLCPRRPGDPPALVAEASAAHANLRWTPTRSLDDMVRTAWAWATYTMHI